MSPEEDALFQEAMHDRDITRAYTNAQVRDMIDQRRRSQMPLTIARLRGLADTKIRRALGTLGEQE